MKLIAYSNTRPPDEATKPYRFVIRQREGHQPFVVHMETFNIEDHIMTHDGYHHGNYCDDLKSALEHLFYRSEQNGLHVQSISYENS